MALPQLFSPRAEGQGLRVLQAHRRVHKYQPVVFGSPVAVVQAAVGGDFVAAAEVLISAAPVELLGGLVVLWAEIKFISCKELPLQ